MRAGFGLLVHPPLHRLGRLGRLEPRLAPLPKARTPRSRNLTTSARSAKKIRARVFSTARALNFHLWKSAEDELFEWRETAENGRKTGGKIFRKKVLTRRVCLRIVRLPSRFSREPRPARRSASIAATRRLRTATGG